MGAAMTSLHGLMRGPWLFQLGMLELGVSLVRCGTHGACALASDTGLFGSEARRAFVLDKYVRRTIGLEPK
jgi:hypothetical protein